MSFCINISCLNCLVGPFGVSFLKDTGRKHTLTCHLPIICFLLRFSQKRGPAALDPTSLLVIMATLACALPWFVRLLPGTAIVCFLFLPCVRVFPLWPSLVCPGRSFPFLDLMVLISPPQ